MGELEEDRVYRETIGRTDVYVAAGLGLAVVSVSHDRIGRFRLTERCVARDVAVVDGRIAVATDADVLIRDAEGFKPTGFGPAVAIGGDEAVLAASEDGTVARYAGDEWDSLDRSTAVRAIDGSLVATADGVFRVEDGLAPLGLTDVADVAAGRSPYAAAADGVYRYDGEWVREHPEPARVVAATDEQAHAVTESGLYERMPDGWASRDPPIESPIADLGYTGGDGADGRGVVGLTTAGTCFVDPVAAKDGATGWRRRMLGLTDVARLAVAPAP